MIDTSYMSELNGMSPSLYWTTAVVGDAVIAIFKKPEKPATGAEGMMCYPPCVKILYLYAAWRVMPSVSGVGTGNGSLNQVPTKVNGAASVNDFLFNRSSTRDMIPSSSLVP